MPSIPHKLRCLALGALTLAAAASAGEPAQAQGRKAPKRDARAEKKACVEAHAKGQSLMRDGKLTAAREEFINCGRETCPGAIRKECAAFLTEVEANQPSIVIEARDELGRPTTDVKVFVDDTEIAASLDGRALEIDPGQHSIRYVSKRGKTIEQSVLILEGQRNRKLSAIFGHPPPPPPPPKPFQIPVLACVAGGVGAVALGNFVVWGLLGNSRQGELEDTCAPRCSQEDADTMRRDFLIADLSLGLAAVALGAAVVITVIDNGEPSPAPAPAPAPVGIVLRPGGVAAFGRF